MSIRVVTMTGEVKYQGDVGPRGPQGIQGEKGDKPIKGVDYFTDADRNSMIEEVIKDSTNEFNVNVENKTKDFNANSTEKTNTFNSNAEAKTDEFNSNAGTLIATYNSNHSSKMAEYDTNSNTKTTEYNNNATQKIGAYNANDTQKTNAYNSNAEQKTTAFNENYTEKLNSINTAEDTALDNISTAVTNFNSNAEEKLNSFNSNSTNKVNEFNENVTNKTTAFDSNATNKTDEFNSNYEEKLGLFNEDANVQRIADLENEVESLNQDLNGVAVNSDELIGEELILTDSADRVRFAKFEIQGNSVNSKNVTSINGKIVGKNLFDESILINGYFSPSYDGTTEQIIKDSKYRTIRLYLRKGVYTLFLSEPYYIPRHYCDGANILIQTVKDKIIVELKTDGIYALCFRKEDNTDIIVNPQIILIKGTTATEYEPYQGQTFNFPLLEGQELNQDSYLSYDGIHNNGEIIPYNAEQKQAYDLLKKLYTYKSTTHVFFEDEVSPKVNIIYRKDKEIENKYLIQDLNGIAVNSEELIGENIAITDGADKVRFKKFNIQGNSVQSGEPTIETPSEIKNVTSVIGKVIGKNFINLPQVYSITGVARDLSINLQPGQYTVSCKSAISDGTTDNFLVYLKYEDGTFESIFVSFEKLEKTFSITKEAVTVSIYSQNTYASSQNVTTIYTELQIEPGIVATPYEPYQEQTFTFPLAENQKLYADSYLADDGIHNLRGQVVFNGSESWNVTANGENYSFWKDNASVPNCLNSPHQKLCDKFTYINNSFRDAPTPCLCENSGTTAMIIFNVPSTMASTVDEWKTYLSSNHLTLEFNLAEEEIIPYTAEQKQAYDLIKKLYTYKGTTHVFFDDEVSPKADLIYRKDIETLINNLQTAIVALGGE